MCLHHLPSYYRKERESSPLGAVSLRFCDASKDQKARWERETMDTRFVEEVRPIPGVV